MGSPSRKRWQIRSMRVAVGERRAAESEVVGRVQTALGDGVWWPARCGQSDGATIRGPRHRHGLLQSLHACTKKMLRHGGYQPTPPTRATTRRSRRRSRRLGRLLPRRRNAAPDEAAHIDQRGGVLVALSALSLANTSEPFGGTKPPLPHARDLCPRP